MNLEFRQGQESRREEEEVQCSGDKLSEENEKDEAAAIF